jgi:hypothetical protein
MSASIPPWASETARLERIRQAEAQSWLRARLGWEHRLRELEDRALPCARPERAPAETTDAA